MKKKKLFNYALEALSETNGGIRVALEDAGAKVFCGGLKVSRTDLEITQTIPFKAKGFEDKPAFMFTLKLHAGDNPESFSISLGFDSVNGYTYKFSEIRTVKVLKDGRYRTSKGSFEVLASDVCDYLKIVSLIGSGDIIISDKGHVTLSDNLLARTAKKFIAAYVAENLSAKDLADLCSPLNFYSDADLYILKIRNSLGEIYEEFPEKIIEECRIFALADFIKRSLTILDERVGKADPDETFGKVLEFFTKKLY